MKTELEYEAPSAKQDKRVIKCVVWDLDNTLWHGVLLEEDSVCLRKGIVDIIKELDGRGLLQSIASKNDYGQAMAKLKEFGCDEYFLHPQINWNSKVASLEAIARSINIGLDAMAFVDDQQYEREEVSFTLPDVMCIDAADIGGLLDMPELRPRFVTDDSKRRRLMYISDLERKKAEEEFVGPKEEFLASLNMTFTIFPAREEDLRRAEELTVRTNQLNTTGRVYSYDELLHFGRSDSHKLFVASLEDKYGSYGNIGLALMECGEDVWRIKLLLMSCRVISRGVGSIFINHIMTQAKSQGVRLLADFVPNDRNRMMHLSFKFTGFKEVEKLGDLVVLENDLTRIQPAPAYVQLHTEKHYGRNRDFETAG